MFFVEAEKSNRDKRGSGGKVAIRLLGEDGFIARRRWICDSWKSNVEYIFKSMVNISLGEVYNKLKICILTKH
jgi:hypothetical protein